MGSTRCHGDTWLVPHRESQALLDRSRSALDPIVALSPRAVTVHPVAQSREVLLRFRGLAFARWDDGRIFFGCPDTREELKASSLPALKNLLQQLENYRHPLATETRHALYRAQPERWLEALVREDVTRVDAALDSRFVYTQVFAHAGGEHGILDLLTVTRSGRLAILELKASEHIHLPLQAAGYWLRIRRHLEQRDFVRLDISRGSNCKPLRLSFILLLLRCASTRPRTPSCVFSRPNWKARASAWRKAGAADCGSSCASTLVAPRVHTLSLTILPSAILPFYLTFHHIFLPRKCPVPNGRGTVQ